MTTIEGRWPKVSVFMPAYNHEDFIAEAIESVLLQNYDPLEIVIGDDGSTDATAEIIRDYANRYPGIVVPIISSSTTGIPHNFNRILDQCTGKYVAVLSADDLWLPGKLHRQIAVMENDPQIVLCYSDCEMFDSTTGATFGLSSEVHGLGKGTLRGGGVEVRFYRFNALKSPTVVYRRSAIGDLRFDYRLTHANDALFDIELLASGGRVAVIDEPLARYRRHDNNVTSSQHLRSTVLEEELVLQAVVEARYPWLVPLTRSKVRVALFADMVAALQRGDHKSARARLASLVSRGDRPKSILVYLLYKFLSPCLASLKRVPLLNELARRLIYR